MFLIIENSQPMDGESYATREEVMRASHYADVGACIIEFDADAVRGNAIGVIVRDVTKAIVTEAHDAGVYDDAEYARQHLAGEFIDFPLSRSEAADARAEQRFEQDRDHQAMGWL